MSNTGEHDYLDDLDPDEDGDDPGAFCGRWADGHLTRSCSMAGTEECDWECPYRKTLYRRDDADLRQILADALAASLSPPQGEGSP